jgi:hypothetical protein
MMKVCYTAMDKKYVLYYIVCMQRAMNRYSNCRANKVNFSAKGSPVQYFYLSFKILTV